MNGSRSTPARRRLRLAALIVAVICVLALAAAAFVVSYPGARDTALHAGVTPRLARIYPATFDAVLVVACAAALALRGVLRGYAWLALLVVTAAIAAADATHAMAVTLPKRPMEATVAVVPWAVLLIGFTLLYAIARQGRPGRAAAQVGTGLGPAGEGGADGDLPAVRRLDAPAGPGNGVGPHRSAATVPLSELLTVKTPATQTGPAPHAGPEAEPAPAPEAGPPAGPRPPKTRRARRKAAAQSPPTPTEPAVTPEPTIPESTTSEATVSALTPESTVAQEPPATPEPTDTTEAPLPSEPTDTTKTPDTSEPADTTDIPGTSKSADTTATPEFSAALEPTLLPEATVLPDSTETAESAGVPEPAFAQEPPLSHEPTVGPEPEDTSEPAAFAQGASATLPELPRRRSVLRDEPSDADAESAEPAAYFNRLRSSPTPPGD